MCVVGGWGPRAGAQGGGGSKGFGETGQVLPQLREGECGGEGKKPQGQQQPPCGMRFLGSQPASSQGGA